MYHVDVVVTYEDMKEAMSEIRPSAMREVSAVCKNYRASSVAHLSSACPLSFTDHVRST
jgi:hypothetical protein